MPKASEAEAELGARIEAATRAVNRELADLEARMKRIAEGERDPEDFPKVAAARAEKAKLAYRAHILQKAIDAEEAKGPRPGGGVPNKPSAKPPPPPSTPSEGCGLLQRITALFEAAIQTAFPQLDAVKPDVTEATKPAYGDFQCNNAMGIAAALGKLGEKLSPPQVAAKIVQSLPKDPIIEKTEVKGPGFVNLFLAKDVLGNLVRDLLLKGVAPPNLPKKRVVIDYSAPNIAKEMHVGHLRSTIIGESLSRLMGYVGWDVLRLNHIGDWGTQFGMLIAHLQDKFPDYKSKTPPLAHLQAFYRESKKRFDEDEAFKKRAYECVVALQAHEPDFIQAWKLICDVSRADFLRIYERLDVSLVERGESFYQERMKSLVEELLKEGRLTEQEGRQLLFVGNREVPLTVVKSDGGFTYDTSDLAAIRQRLKEENADWILYVVDKGQSLHLETVYEAARQLGWYSEEEKRVKHVAFGVVLGEDGKKFKTRSGDTVRLTDLLDEGIKRAQDKLVEKGRDSELNADELAKAAESVAYGCIKYADLSSKRTNDYVFSFDKMLDDRGNTAVYLLYALTRIKAIARNAGVERAAIVEWLSKGEPLLREPQEAKLARGLVKFPDVIRSAIGDLMLHPLCEFLYELSTLFNEFYAKCYCVQKDKEGNVTIHYHRLALCEATADVMEQGFAILGIRPLQKM